MGQIIYGAFGDGPVQVVTVKYEDSVFDVDDDPRDRFPNVVADKILVNTTRYDVETRWNDFGWDVTVYGWDACSSDTADVSKIPPDQFLCLQTFQELDAIIKSLQRARRLLKKNDQ